MKIAGHFTRLQSGGPDDHVRLLKCNYCGFAISPKTLHQRGDKSGLARYARALAKVRVHLHQEHRDKLLFGPSGRVA